MSKIDIRAEAIAAAEAHDRAGTPDGEFMNPYTGEDGVQFAQEFWAALQDLRGEASA
jgi:hypothetical protein